MDDERRRRGRLRRPVHHPAQRGHRPRRSGPATASGRCSTSTTATVNCARSSARTRPSTSAAGPAYLGGPTRPRRPPQPPIQTQPGAYAFTAYPAAQRVLDSRNGIGGPVGPARRRPDRAPWRSACRRGRALPSSTSRSTTVALPKQQCRPPSYLVAWKPGTGLPATSNANVGACDVAANSAVVQVDAAGAINVQVYADVDVIIDVLGYYTPANGPVAAGRFQGVTPGPTARHPCRLGVGQRVHPHDSGQHLDRAFRGGRSTGCAGGAKTVSLTVTAIGPGSDAPGYVTAYAGRHGAAGHLDGQPHRRRSTPAPTSHSYPSARTAPSNCSCTRSPTSSSMSAAGSRRPAMRPAPRATASDRAARASPTAATVSAWRHSPRTVR